MHKKNDFVKNKRLHVFVADDDEDDMEFLMAALKEISPNIKITTAKDGRELLDFVQVVMPGIVFLDVNMPCMNGLACLAELRQLKHLQNVPIIMYSTGARDEDVEQSYVLGANGYIKKPGNFISIKAQLSKVLASNLAGLLLQPSREKYLINLDETPHLQQQ